MTPSEWQKFCQFCREDVVNRLPYNFSEQDRKDLTQQAIFFVLDNPNLFQMKDDLPLTSYQKNRFRCIIRRNLYPHIRKITGNPTDGYSNLGLISRLSLEKIRQVLKNRPLLNRYILAYQCFNEVKNAHNVNVNNLTPEHFELMSDRYNQLSNFPRINANDIKQYLESIGTIIRDSRKTRIDSIDAKDANEHFHRPSNYVDLPSNYVETSPESAEIRERLFSILDRIHTDKSPKLSRKLMILFHYYGINLNIPEISKILHINPGTISREKTQVKTYIFKQMCEVYHIPKGEIILERIDELDIFLEEYYHSRFREITRYSIKSLIPPWETVFYLTDRIVQQFEQNFNNKLDDFVQKKIYTWIENNLQYI